MAETRDDELGLTPLFPVRGFEGSFAEYVDQLYWQYQAMLDGRTLQLWGKPVVSSSPVRGVDGRERRFWHLVTEAGPPCGTRRVVNLRRCETLPRVWALLERLSGADPRVLWWSERSRDRNGGKATLMVASTDFGLYVVLREQRDRFKLVTAYPVDGEDRRRRLRERAAASWQEGRSQGRLERRWSHRAWRELPEVVRLPAAGLRPRLAGAEVL